MASYVILTRLEHPASDPTNPLVLRDGFHWLAFLCPPVWFLWHRMWRVAILYLGLSLAISIVFSLLERPAAEAFAFLALNLIAGFEASNLRHAMLVAKGYRLAMAIVADDRDAADEIYFSTGEAPLSPGPEVRIAPSGWSRSAIGLVELKGGR